MGVGVSDVACQQSIYAPEREQGCEGLACGVQRAATTRVVERGVWVGAA